MTDRDIMLPEPDDDIILRDEQIRLLEERIEKAEEMGIMICSEASISASLEQIKQDREILFTYKDTECKLVVLEDTKILDDIPSNESHIFFRHHENAFETKNTSPVTCWCTCALSESDALLFEGLNINLKQRRVETFFKLQPQQRAFIRNQHSLPEQNLADYYHPIIDEDALILLYESCGKTYPPEVQIQAELLIKEIKEDRFSQSRYDQIKRLSYLLNNNSKRKEIRNISYDEIIDILDKYVYGMSTLKRIIAERIMLLLRTGKTISGILLVGNPGVGKSTIGRGISECYDLPFEEIKCDGADPLVLKGLFSSYAGAKPGNPATKFYQRGTTQLVLLIEEIDKLASNTERCDPYGTLNTMLGPEKVLHDEFVDVDWDVSDTIIIATCNDKNKIPGYIMDRFSLIVEIDDLTPDDKVCVARDYIIPEFFTEYHLSDRELIFEDSALKLISNRYCDDFGARKMRSCIDSIICTVVTGWSKGTLSVPFKVTADFAQENLDVILGRSKTNTIGF